MIALVFILLLLFIFCLDLFPLIVAVLNPTECISERIAAGLILVAVVAVVFSLGV